MDENKRVRRMYVPQVRLDASMAPVCVGGGGGGVGGGGEGGILIFS